MSAAPRLAARGWTREGGELYETLDRLERAGCARYVVTDVASDGMLSGPNLDLLRAVCDRTDSPVVASGGISSLTDIADLAALVPGVWRAPSSAPPCTSAASPCRRRWWLLVGSVR